LKGKMRFSTSWLTGEGVSIVCAAYSEVNISIEFDTGYFYKMRD
jgi:hypothetical protein